MNMFYELPYFVKIKNKKYAVKTDFRIFAEYEEEMQDRNEENRKKAIAKVLSRFYPAFLEIVENNLLEEAVNQFMWFYECGRKNYHKVKNSKGNKREEIYSFNYDDEYIYSAFLEKYRIDLSRNYVHWWKFQALLKGLGECEFTKIKGYRAYNGKDKEMLEIKEYWALPKKQNIEYEKRKAKILKQLEAYGKD